MCCCFVLAALLRVSVNDKVFCLFTFGGPTTCRVWLIPLPDALESKREGIGVLFFGGAFGGEGDKSGEVAAHFDFINKEPSLLTGADVPFGHFAVVYGFDFNIAGRGIGAGAGELVLHTFLFALTGNLELGVFHLSPNRQRGW